MTYILWNYVLISCSPVLIAFLGGGNNCDVISYDAIKKKLQMLVQPILTQITQTLLDDGYAPAWHLQRLVRLMASCHTTVLLCLF